MLYDIRDGFYFTGAQKHKYTHSLPSKDLLFVNQQLRGRRQSKTLPAQAD